MQDTSSAHADVSLQAPAPAPLNDTGAGSSCASSSSSSSFTDSPASGPLLHIPLNKAHNVPVHITVGDVFAATASMQPASSVNGPTGASSSASSSSSSSAAPFGSSTVSSNASKPAASADAAKPNRNPPYHQRMVDPLRFHALGQVRYKLGDFGLAVNVASNNAEDGDSRYLPPEIMSSNNPPNLPAADIYSLGLTVYELASGRLLPTRGKAYRNLRKGRLELAQVAHLSPMLQELLLRMVSADPYARPTAQELLDHPLLSTIGSTCITLAPGVVSREALAGNTVASPAGLSASSSSSAVSPVFAPAAAVRAPCTSLGLPAATIVQIGEPLDAYINTGPAIRRAHHLPPRTLPAPASSAGSGSVHAKKPESEPIPVVALDDEGHIVLFGETEFPVSAPLHATATTSSSSSSSSSGPDAAALQVQSPLGSLASAAPTSIADALQLGMQRYATAGSAASRPAIGMGAMRDTSPAAGSTPVLGDAGIHGTGTGSVSPDVSVGLGAAHLASRTPHLFKAGGFANTSRQFSTASKHSRRGSIPGSSESARYGHGHRMESSAVFDDDDDNFLPPPADSPSGVSAGIGMTPNVDRLHDASTGEAGSLPRSEGTVSVHTVQPASDGSDKLEVRLVLTAEELRVLHAFYAAREGKEANPATAASSGGVTGQ